MNITDFIIKVNKKNTLYILDFYTKIDLIVCIFTDPRFPYRMLFSISAID